MDSNGNEHREAVREVIETEVRNLINEEMRKAAQDLADEQKRQSGKLWRNRRSQSMR